MSARMLGLAAAGALLAVVGAVIVWSVISAARPAPTGVAGAPDAQRPSPVEMPDTPLDAVDLTDDAAATLDPVAEGDQWEFVDVAPDGSLRYKMIAEQFDPLERGAFRLTKPTAWVYLERHTVRLAADEARLVRRPDEEPESGSLRGSVVAEVFDAGAPDDAPAGDALAVMRTGSLAFEAALGQIDTPDEVRIDTAGRGGAPAVSFVGTGMTVRLGEIERGERFDLRLFRIERGRELRIAPGTSADASNADNADPGGGADRQDQDGSESFYRITVEGDVRIGSGTLALQADEVTGWTRLVGGALPKDAVGPIDLAPPRATPTERVAANGERAADGADGSPEIVVAWSGPLEARPIDRPAELAADDAAVRITSAETGTVRITDETLGVRVASTSLFYGLTSRRLDLRGVGDAVGVRVAFEGVGELATGRIAADLAEAPSVTAELPGAGMLRQDAAAGDGEIQWSQRSDIQLGPTPSGRVALDAVSFEGNVRARSGQGSIGGTFLRAVFDRGRDAERPAMARLIVDGEAVAADASGGRVEADHLDVVFSPGAAPGRTLPASAVARGRVLAERDGERLHAEAVEVAFDNRSGRSEVARVHADVGVSVEMRGRLTVAAERLRADLAARVADLSGAPAEVRRAEDRGVWSLSGSDMTLDDTAGTVVVRGRGAAEYRASSHAAGGYRDARVEWADGLRYDDRAGAADVAGHVIATGTTAAGERHLARGAFMTLDVSTADAAREIRRVALRGASEPDADPAPAFVEARRYAGAGASGEPRLDLLVRLQGDEIVADTEAETVAVDTPGLLIVEDRVARDASAAAPDDLGERLRGTSVFDWSGAFLLDRRRGRAQISRDVRVRHLHPGTQAYTELLSEQIVALLGPRGEQGSAGNDRPEVRRIDATEAVYARHATAELVADAVTYEAGAGEVAAAAAPGNRVTVLDAEEGRHFTAERIVLDILSGAWRATRAVGGGATALEPADP